MIRRLAFAVSLSAIGCGFSFEPGSATPKEPSEGSGEFASIEAELLKVPSATSCLQITIVGTQTVVRGFPVAAGASTAKLSLGKLPAGNVSVSGAAYGTACLADAGTPDAEPTWLADPVAATRYPSVAATVRLEFVPNVAASVTGNFRQATLQAAPGDYSTFSLLADGTVRGWGTNGYGQLGLGDAGYPVYSPAALPVLTSVTQVSHRLYHGCALRSDGTVRCWGLNDNGMLGQGNYTSSYAPILVPGVTNVRAISAGSNFTFALLNDDTLTAWGSNGQGSLGNGSMTNSFPSPVVTGITNVAVIATGGAHACVISNARGSVLCWGANYSGQVGNNTVVTPQRSPYGIGLLGATQLALGTSHSCALLANGTVQCWGANSAGMIGDGTFTQRLVPTPVTGLTNVKSLAAGGSHTCAVLADETVKCWGYNAFGQLGNSTFSHSPTPVLVTGLTGVKAVFPGGGTTCAVTNAGALYCWGENGNGQLGQGHKRDLFAPTLVAY